MSKAYTVTLFPLYIHLSSKRIASTALPPFLFWCTPNPKDVVAPDKDLSQVACKLSINIFLCASKLQVHVCIYGD